MVYKMKDTKKTNCVAVTHNISGGIYVVSGSVYSDKTLEKLNYTILKRGDCLQLDREYR